MLKIKEKTKKLLKRITNIAGAGLLGTYLLTQVDALVSQGYFKESSLYRQEFKDQFGFPIYGLKEDVEENPNNLPVISEALRKNQDTRPFHIRSVNIQPKRFLKRTFLQQLLSVMKGGAYYNPIADSITLKSGGIESKIVNHEIKHSLTEKILRKYPGLKSEWLSLGTDNTGKSMYLSYFGGFLHKISDFEALKTSFTKEEGGLSGFVSDYAKTNFREDIAELCAEAETSPNSLVELEPNLRDDSPIVKKLKLAEKYGIVARNFMDYLQLERKYLQCVCPSIQGLDRSDNADLEFYKGACKFINENPKSRYQSDIKGKMDIIGKFPNVQRFLSKNDMD